MANDILLVNEIFGPTFQGEGPSLGRQAVFLRLAMCNLKCTWCDTKYTWDWDNYSKADEVHVMPIDDVQAEILAKAGNSDMLVISGGEPLLQHRNIAQLFAYEPLRRFTHRFGRIEIETNGTIYPTELEGMFDWEMLRLNVSPKLEHSGNGAIKALKFGVLDELHHSFNSVFKFVVTSVEDLDEVAQIQHWAKLDSERIWIMPEGRTQRRLESVAKHICQSVLDRGWNLTTRMHVMLWADLRGR